jgi:hypothetical protein
VSVLETRKAVIAVCREYINVEMQKRPDLGVLAGSGLDRFGFDIAEELQPYLTTDWNKGDVRRLANWLSDDE